MKRFLTAFFASIYALFLFTSCSSSARQANTANPDIVNNTAIQTTANSEAINVNNVNDLIKISDTVAKVEIIGEETFSEKWKQQRYLCKVITDYFGNLDYTGLEEGQIYIYEINDPYDVGDVVYMFLGAKDLICYPHMVYTSVEKKFRPKENENGIEFFNEFNYGLTKEDDLDEILIDYAANATVPTLSRLSNQSKIASFEQANEASDEVWLVKMIDRKEQNEYCASVTFEILEVKKGDYKLSEVESDQNIYMEIVPAKQEFEKGASYIMFRKVDSVHNTMSIASKDYCLLKQDQTEFKQILESYSN